MSLDRLIPLDVRARVSNELRDIAAGISSNLGRYPVALRETVTGRVDEVLLAIDQMHRVLCGEVLGGTVPARRSRTSCSVPLKVSLEEAWLLSGTFAPASERINALLEVLKEGAPGVPSRLYAPAAAAVIGTIFIELLKPAWDQHPALSSAFREA